MLKSIILFLLLFSHLNAIEIDENTQYIELLPQSEIYIDKRQKESIDTVKDKNFTPSHSKLIGYGYSPNFDVWVRFLLHNRSDKPQHILLEYANPLTSHVTFYKNEHLLQKEGLLSPPKKLHTINPVVEIMLEPHESSTYYVKASSHITTMLVSLKLYEPHIFYDKELKHQLILALFFGVMAIIIIYNFIVFVMTQEKSYLYYVLFFVGITFHHLIYRGFAHTYLFSAEMMEYTIHYSIFIVAFPAFFLALFIKEILNLKQHPKVDKILRMTLYLFPFLVLFVSFWGHPNYRNAPTMFLLLFLFGILLFMIFKKNRYAYYIATGWILFISSALAMQLSSMGKYEIFDTYPYYGEFALIMEGILFSLILSSKIKHLHAENTQAKEQLITQQKQEKIKLKKEVSERTSELRQSLSVNKILFKELNHRVKNSLQTILSFVRLQSQKTSHSETKNILETLKNRILSIDHLHQLLHENNMSENIEAKVYFLRIAQDLQKSFSMPHINIKVNTICILTPSNAFSCGLIVNEAVTNAFKYAFIDMDKGEISIELKEKNQVYTLTIKDTGKGYEAVHTPNTLGLELIKSLVTIELNGEVSITHEDGVFIQITWKENLPHE